MNKIEITTSCDIWSDLNNLKNKSNIYKTQKVFEAIEKKWVSGDYLLSLPSTQDHQGITGNGEEVVLIQMPKKDYDKLKGDAE